MSHGCDNPGIAFYPSSHAYVRPPETVHSRSGHVSGGTFSVSVGIRPVTVRARRARETRRGQRLGQLQNGLGRNPAGRRTAPQCNHQPPRERYDADAPQTFRARKSVPIPARERTVRLPAQPIPRQLNGDRLQPRIPGATDSLLVARLPAVIGRRRKPQDAADLAAIVERAPDEAFVDQSRGAGHRHPLEPDQARQRGVVRRRVSRTRLLRVELADLGLELERIGYDRSFEAISGRGTAEVIAAVPSFGSCRSPPATSHCWLRAGRSPSGCRFC